MPAFLKAWIKRNDGDPKFARKASPLSALDPEQAKVAGIISFLRQDHRLEGPEVDTMVRAFVRSLGPEEAEEGYNEVNRGLFDANGSKSIDMLRRLFRAAYDKRHPHQGANTA